MCILTTLKYIFIFRLDRFDISDYESPGESFELETRGLFSSSVLAVPLEVGAAVITATVLFHGSPVSKNICKS